MLFRSERAQELLAGRRAWELANEGIEKPKKSRGSKGKSKKSAPTLTENTVKEAGAKRKSKKSADGKPKKAK